MPTDDDFGSVFDQVVAEGAGDAPADNGPNVGNAKVFTGQEVSDETSDGDEDLFDDKSTDEGGEVDDDAPVDESDDDSADNAEVFNWTDHKDELVEVKVNGEMVSVPLGEALNGYLRQEDYTRKTQAIAQDRQYSEWAKSLKSALDQDPASVVYKLAEAYGIPLGEAADDGDDDYDDDPALRKVSERAKAAEQRLAQQEAQLERLEQERVMNEVKQELADVRSKYADFNPEVVLPYAVKEGLTIEKAYLTLKGVEATTNASRAAEAKRKADEKAALEAAKRKNAKKVQRGGVRGTPSKSERVFDSFEDMFTSELEDSKK